MLTLTLLKLPVQENAISVKQTQLLIRIKKKKIRFIRKKSKRNRVAKRIHDFTIIIYSVGILATLNLLDKHRKVKSKKRVFSRKARIWRWSDSTVERMCL